MLSVFVVGTTQPVEASSTKQIFQIIFHQLLTLTLCSSLLQYGIKKIKHMPYNHQHQYFFLGMFFLRVIQDERNHEHSAGVTVLCFSHSGTTAAHSSFLPHSDNAHHDLPPWLGGKILSWNWNEMFKFFYLRVKFRPNLQHCRGNMTHVNMLMKKLMSHDSW